MEQTTIKSEKNERVKNMEQDDRKFIYTFDGRGKEDAVDTLKKFSEECNAKDYGKKITVSDIIARGLRKLEFKDMELLQEQSMGLKDSLRQKYKTEKGVEASDDEFVRWLLEEYTPQKHRKRPLQ